MVILPIAKGEAGIDLYRNLPTAKSNTDITSRVSIVGVDFGCRDTVFKDDLTSDTKLLGSVCTVTDNCLRRPRKHFYQHDQVEYNCMSILTIKYV